MQYPGNDRNPITVSSSAAIAKYAETSAAVAVGGGGIGVPLPGSDSRHQGPAAAGGADGPHRPESTRLFAFWWVLIAGRLSPRCPAPHSAAEPNMSQLN